ncbi:Uncharacterised protein [uncultured archaeon]|nr:Uncharacterised protein [uncultured archaeon]
MTNATGFNSLEVTSGIYNLTAAYDITYYTNSSVTVSTASGAVVLQDIELLKRVQALQKKFLSILSI